MITPRRSQDRHHVRRRRHDLWLTFHAGKKGDALADGFGALEILNEDLLPPGAGIWLHRNHDAEIITYVLQGALSHADSTGRSDVIYAGEFQHLAAGRGVRHSATNPSRTDWTRVFQLWLRPTEVGLEPGHAHKRFSAGERRGALCLVASPDGRGGSLRLHQDTRLYSALLDAGTHLVHELLPQRSAWLHVVRGEVTLADTVLSAGDGASVTAERTVSLTAHEGSEILLVDLHQPHSHSLAMEDSDGQPQRLRRRAHRHATGPAHHYVQW